MGLRDGGGVRGDGVDLQNDPENQNSAVKEEGIDEQELNRNHNGSDSGDGGCAASSAATPMEGLHEIGLAPFLKKTYEMVEDPDTDPVVSWSEARSSFIVWDSHQLSKNLLPKYFKHCNFSSFVRQLNTYGFRKIRSDKWEFANEGFQGGKKHLLKNIKRRSKYHHNQQQLHEVTAMALEDLTKPVVETELETLETENNYMKVELLKLREQQQKSQNQLTLLEERVRSVECKQQQMFNFLTKMVRNPALIRRLVQKRMLRKKLNGNQEFEKKRRLLAMPRHGNLGVHPIVASQDVNYENHVPENFLSMQSELTEVFVGPEPEPVEMPFQTSCDHESISLNAACTPRSETFAENMVVNEEFTANGSNFFLEFEDLIKKPHDCAPSYVQKQVLPWIDSMNFASKEFEERILP